VGAGDRIGREIDRSLAARVGSLSDTKLTNRFWRAPRKGVSLYCIYIVGAVQDLDSKQIKNRSKQLPVR
jgi:hypothetical protein